MDFIPVVPFELLFLALIALSVLVPRNAESQKELEVEKQRFNYGYCVNDDTRLELIAVSDEKAYYHCNTCGEDFSFNVDVTNINK